MQGIIWTWPESFVNALYIPFAFSNLPRNFPIQLVGGLQAVAVTLLGWNIFFRHLNNRFERIAVAASELRGAFEDRVLQVKFALLKEQAAKPVVIDAVPVEAVSTELAP
jgi:hypothetical protein